MRRDFWRESKRFGDLKEGDNVFYVILGPERWIIHVYRVLEVESGLNDVKLILEDESKSGYYPRNLISARENTIWSDREEALKFALEKVKKDRDYLSEKIDNLISKYDKIEEFIKRYE